MVFDPKSTEWTRPADGGGIAITPGASALSHMIRGIACDVAGTVTVTSPAGVSYTTHTLAAGVIHPIAATHVTAATATGLVGYY